MAVPARVMDSVFHALSDATRRSVVERLRQRPASVSELAAPYRMALPSFVQHLRVLEGAGLVRSRKSGRVRTYTLESGRLRLAQEWLDVQRQIWETRFDQMDAHLLTLKERSR